MNIESVFASHVATLQAESVPASAKTSLSALWLDTVAVMLAGYLNPECRNIAKAFAGAGGTTGCSIIGERTRVAPSGAAFANGVFAHWYDWDDTHDDSHVHASAVIFPALLAAFESAGRTHTAATAREFMVACVAAMDLACRIGGALKKHSHRGWMPTGSGGTIGAAAGAARLLRLDEQGILSAMGIAAAGVGLSRQALADRVNGKNVLAGMAAKNAIDAALLARQGVAGAPNFLTGIYGLQALYAVPVTNSAGGADGLKQRYAVSEISTKPYPSCRSTHAALDLVFDLLTETPKVKTTVRAVELDVPPGVYERCGRPFSAGQNPRISAQFSLPFTVSLALRKGQVTPADFEPTRVLSYVTEFGDLIPTVTVRAVASAQGAEDVQLPITARFVMSDGSIVEKTATEMKGSPSRPTTLKEARHKLAVAVGDHLTVQQQEDVASASLRLCETGPHEVLELLEILDQTPSMPIAAGIRQRSTSHGSR